MYSDPNMLLFSTVIFNVDNDDVSYLLLLSLLCYVLLFYACDTKCAALEKKNCLSPPCGSICCLQFIFIISVSLDCSIFSPVSPCIFVIHV